MCCLLCRSLLVVGGTVDHLKGDDYVCHRLMHIVPSEDFKSFTVEFGSSYIAQQIYAHATDEVDEFLRASLQPTRRSLIVNIVGQGFESYSHRKLARGGTFCRAMPRR